MLVQLVYALRFIRSGPFPLLSLSPHKKFNVTRWKNIMLSSFSDKHPHDVLYLLDLLIYWDLPKSEKPITLFFVEKGQGSDSTQYQAKTLPDFHSSLIS